MFHSIPPNVRRFVANAACLLTTCMACFILAATLLHVPKLTSYVNNYLEINRTLQRLFAIVLLISASSLYHRIRTAWMITLLMLTSNLLLNILSYHHFITNLLLACQAFVVVILLLCQGEFTRPIRPLTRRRGLWIGIVFLLMVLLNSSLGFFNLRAYYKGPINFMNCIVNSLQILLGETPAKFAFSKHMIYEYFIFALDWICILGGLLLMLKPMLTQNTSKCQEQEHVLALVRSYGQNPSAYLALEPDKTYFFGSIVDGVIAYGIVRDVAVVCGDPICADKDFVVLLTEFKSFCIKNNYDIVFLAITNQYLEHYIHLGFGHVKCGEEPRIDLNNYTLAGGKIAKVRASINHSRKAGVTVKEYQPLLHRDAALEQAFDSITREWLASKKSGELSFTLGSPGLHNPMDKRYFYAKTEDGTVHAFMVFLPFMGGEGCLEDVVRRRMNAPAGIMEQLFYDSSQILKADGVRWLSLGLAPLANLAEDGEPVSPSVKLLHFIYENMNQIYGFKDLYRAKLKYNPAIWEPAYFAYSPKIMTPQIAYAVIKIQNPQGVLDYIKSFIRNTKKERRSSNEEKSSENT